MLNTRGGRVNYHENISLMLSALWKVKRKPRIDDSDKSGDSVYRTLRLVSAFAVSILSSLV